MSQETVEIVGGMFTSWMSGDRASARAAYDPHAVMIIPVIDTPVMYGLEAIERGMESWRRSWDGWQMETEETIDAGDHVTGRAASVRTPEQRLGS